VNIVDVLQTPSEQYALLDVRSPAEFAQGHIPGAISFPLFSDEERAIVGTAYKHQSPDHAMQAGLSIIGPRMHEMVTKARAESAGRPIVVQCWRGGKRSGSVGWLLDFAGLPTSVVDGGYKSYRTHLRTWLEETPLNLLVLGGATGSGKTELLGELSKLGEQVLDLEGLANHKGSAFGWIGEENQPNTEQFENDIFEVLRAFDPSKRIWVENESRSIGRVFIPEILWTKMKSAFLIHLEVPLELRVQKLVEMYAEDGAKEALSASFVKIGKRLGGQHVKAALEAVNNGEYHQAAEIALTYYDKTYYYGLEQSKAPSIEKIFVNDWQVEEITTALLHTARKMQMQEVTFGNGI
jgi:tRNA 2-selenouridine synthase